MRFLGSKEVENYLESKKLPRANDAESMRQSESFVPNLSREDKNLFDKMKENF